MTQVVAFPGEAPPEPQRSGRRRFPLIAVLLLTALAITLAGIFPFRQMIAQQRQVDQTQAHLDTLVEENRALEDKVAALNSPAEIERIAREQFGLVRPGETSYVVDTPTEAVPPSLAPPAEEVVDERSLLQRFWDFLTGRDLVPDE
jgi:cell division protein FtsL